MSHAERMQDVQRAAHVELRRYTRIDAHGRDALRRVHVRPQPRGDMDTARRLELQPEIATENGLGSDREEPRVVGIVEAATVGLEPEAIESGVEPGLQCGAWPQPATELATQ